MPTASRRAERLSRLARMPDVQESAKIPGVYIVRLQSYPDERGRFVETFRREWIPSGREHAD